MDISSGEKVYISLAGCRGWNWQAGGLEEEQQRRFMDVVKEHMKLFAAREEVAVDRVRWRQMIGGSERKEMCGAGGKGTHPKKRKRRRIQKGQTFQTTK